MTKTFLKAAVLGGTALALGLLSTAPAHAFTFTNQNNDIVITASDAGQSFTTLFDGNVNGNNVIGLTAQAVFKFLGFTSVGSGSNTKTEAAFQIDLTNTSSNGITSRISALGFDVSPSLLGVGSSGGSGNTRVSGIFNNDRAGSFPNGFGDIDVCFTNGNTCQGGSNGGVSNGTGQFSPILAFSGTVGSFTLSNFGVRYQSVTGTDLGNSGTGRGKVPTPALLPGLIALGASVLRKRKGEQMAEANAEV